MIANIDVSGWSNEQAQILRQWHQKAYLPSQDDAFYRDRIVIWDVIWSLAKQIVVIKHGASEFVTHRSADLANVYHYFHKVFEINLVRESINVEGLCGLHGSMTKELLAPYSANILIFQFSHLLGLFNQYKDELHAKTDKECLINSIVHAAVNKLCPRERLVLKVQVRKLLKKYIDTSASLEDAKDTPLVLEDFTASELKELLG